MNFSLYRIFNRYFRVSVGKENTRKIKLFSYSLVVGVLASLLVLSFISKTNPITSLIDGIKKAFDTPDEKAKMFTKIAILGLAGIAVGVGFKTGLFNMGVSGQMIMGGFSAGYMALILGNSVSNGVGQILVLLISVVGGMIFAMIAGALKAYFKIHEVVSTILLNWIAFYFMTWILTSESMSNSIMDPTRPLWTNRIGENYLLRFNGSALWPSVIILVSVAVIMWFTIFKTTFGRSLVMVGKNPDAAKYAGINTKLLSIYSMGISGAIAGLLGAVFYLGLGDSFKKPDIAQGVPSEGFNGIAIALIAFSHPICILPVAFFFGMIQQGFALAGNAQNISLIVGIIMLFSAINIIFDKIKYTHWYYRIRYGKLGAEAHTRYSESKLHAIEDVVNAHPKTKEEKEELLDKHFKHLKAQKAKFRKEIKSISKEKQMEGVN